MMNRFLHPFSWALPIFAVVVCACGEQEPFGYKDTPVIPGTEWRVHDGDRPQPKIVTPGEEFSEQAAAPSDAVVLFDGSDLSQWQKVRGGEAGWKLEDEYMEVAGESGSIRTKEQFADFQLHLEFASPADATGDGQGRGNSGVIFNGLYEIQVLDSYENKTYPDGQAAAMYGQAPPLANASRPPGEWQTYDILFESPRWNDGGELVKKAIVTVIHNGVVVHHRRAFHGESRHRAVGDYDEPHEPEVFIELQDHSDPVRFRNIWVRPIDE